jgi:hypothetical protein
MMSSAPSMHPRVASGDDRHAPDHLTLNATHVG